MDVLPLPLSNAQFELLPQHPSASRVGLVSSPAACKEVTLVNCNSRISESMSSSLPCFTIPPPDLGIVAIRSLPLVGRPATCTETPPSLHTALLPSRLAAHARNPLSC